MKDIYRALMGVVVAGLAEFAQGAPESQDERKIRLEACKEKWRKDFQSRISEYDQRSDASGKNLCALVETFHAGRDICNGQFNGGGSQDTATPQPDYIQIADANVALDHDELVAQIAVQKKRRDHLAWRSGEDAWEHYKRSDGQLVLLNRLKDCLKIPKREAAAPTAPHHQ